MCITLSAGFRYGLLIGLLALRLSRLGRSLALWLRAVWPAPLTVTITLAAWLRLCLLGLRALLLRSGV